MREYYLESKLAVNFISKLIYWLNLFIIYFLKIRAQARFLIGLVILVSLAPEVRSHYFNKAARTAANSSFFFFR
jgi:hypothetical protein